MPMVGWVAIREQNDTIVLLAFVCVMIVRPGVNEEQKIASHFTVMHHVWVCVRRAMFWLAKHCLKDLSNSVG